MKKQSLTNQGRRFYFLFRYKWRQNEYPTIHNLSPIYINQVMSYDFAIVFIFVPRFLLAFAIDLRLLF